ncbi:hypothetical protein KUCAC02_015719 [Chaenocephalus aceratus]|uniref:Uncharacterized protein n=1 Tax=Chaenocephalus aceratus TaxID=36190 RepID=A0ACB9XZ76_CHAAC|nr:hypothetical protein KUCAC02_015719 [Chaenocephalus aceratus]
MMPLQYLCWYKHFLIGGVTVSYSVLCEDQHGHHPNHKFQVKQLQSNMQTRQQQRDTEGRHSPRTKARPGGVREGAEDKSRDGEDESEQRGGEPGGQGQRRQEERHCCLAC